MHSLIDLNGMEQLAQNFPELITFPATHVRTGDDHSGTHALSCPREAKMIRFQMSDDYYAEDTDWSLNGKSVTLRYSDGSRCSPGTMVKGELYTGEIVDTGTIQLTVPPPKNNENILINSRFHDPINQRGKTTYPNGGQYTIDQWWFRSDGSPPSSVSIVDGGVRIERVSEVEKAISLNQRIEGHERLVGREITCSVLVKENRNSNKMRWGMVAAQLARTNSHHWLTRNIPAGKSGLFCMHGIVPSMSSLPVDDYGNTMSGINFAAVDYETTSAIDITFIAAKLELGNKQTLAHLDENGEWVENEPWYDREKELARCQRYMYVPCYDSEYGVIGYGPVSNPNYLWIMVELPVPMLDYKRVTASKSGTFYISRAMNVHESDEEKWNIISQRLDPVSSTQNRIWFSTKTDTTTLVKGDVYYMRTSAKTDEFYIQAPIDYT